VRSNSKVLNLLKLVTRLIDILLDEKAIHGEKHVWAKYPTTAVWKHMADLVPKLGMK